MNIVELRCTTVNQRLTICWGRPQNTAIRGESSQGQGVRYITQSVAKLCGSPGSCPPLSACFHYISVVLDKDKMHDTLIA